MSYRKYTQEDVDEKQQSFINERIFNFEDEEIPECCVIDGDWEVLELPTGLFPFIRTGDGIMITHDHMLDHGRRYQEVHAPDKVHLVGGSTPF